MHLTDIRVDRFGSLSNTAVDNLSRRITVFYGPNGSGKTTGVRFLRGVLFGFGRNSSDPLVDGSSESGFLRIQTGQGTRTLQRASLSSGVEQFTVTGEPDRQTSLRHDNHLPTWVSEDVFREVFSVGYEEADRFDLLSRLCIESGAGRSFQEAELHQAEAALLQTVRDRDGNGVQGGVVQRISELRRRQAELQSEISTLRKPAGDLPRRIEQLILEIESAVTSMGRIDTRLTEFDAEIARLEQLLMELRRRNILPLNQQTIEEEIRTVTGRMEGWREIRGLISRQMEARRVTADANLQSAESVRSLRAIVSRLEERVQALCAERCLSDTAQMERLLEEQLAILRADMARSENILADTALPKPMDGCRFIGHQVLGHQESPGGEIAGSSVCCTVADAETQIQRLHAERGRLISERASMDESRSAKRILWERLRQELAGAASLEQLDALRAHMAGLDAEILLLEDQRRQLDRTEASLREVMQRLNARGHSRVFELASAYVRRLTEGDCRQISATRPDRLHIHTTNHAEPLSLVQLSRGTRDQVALALRLALIQVRAEIHGHVPLILDDVFITSDDVRATATVELLTEIAEHGQQIIFFTCQKDVRDLFARFNADIRSFGAQAKTPDAPAQPVAPLVLHAWMEPAIESHPAAAQPIEVPQLTPRSAPSPLPPQTPPSAPGIAEPAQLTTATNWLFYLEVDHGVEDLAGITLGELEALRTTGILNITDLLNHTVPQLEEAARQKGFQLSVDRLHALRGQAELTTRVPMLRRSDAALLFASGIRSVEELSRLRPETVYDRVTEFQRTDVGSRYRRGGRLIDRQQAINWARYGQFTRSLDDALHCRSRFSPRPLVRRQAPSTQISAGASSAVVKEMVSEQADSGHPGSSRRRRRLTEDVNTEERRARRIARRRRQSSRLRTQTAESGTDESAPVERSGGMRFFLNRTSEVEKSPSIGPRTAEMLEAIGIRTVEDFLSMAPERLAEKLSHRRITAPVIQQWQCQSRLVCQIPELRGHDAQILVACGITAPEGLAAQKPAELYAVVEPFSRSKEGERIIRNDRKPDLKEVTEWIQWAANARSMRAA